MSPPAEMGSASEPAPPTQGHVDSAVKPPLDTAVYAETESDVFFISFADITLEPQLGHGAFATTAPGFYNGQPVAIVWLRDGATPETVARVRTLRKLSPRHVLRCLGMCTEPGNECVVFERANEFVAALSGKAPWDTRWWWASEIALGMAHLYSHSPPVAHGNLKASTVMLSTDGSRVLLSDIDVSTPSGHAVDPSRAAPELLSGDAPFSEKCDVYAYGLLMWEIATGFDGVWKSHSMVQTVKAVLAGERPKIPDNCAPAYAALMQRSWDQDPAQRPTFAEVAEEAVRCFHAAKSRSDSVRAKVTGAASSVEEGAASSTAQASMVSADDKATVAQPPPRATTAPQNASANVGGKSPAQPTATVSRGGICGIL